MKILHLINNLSLGGAELHLLTLSRHLQRQGIEVVVAYLKEQTQYSRSLRADFADAGIRVISLSADNRYDFRFVPALIRLLHTEQPAILHTHLPRADLAGAVKRLVAPSVAWVSSVHGMYSETWAGRWTLPLCSAAWRQTDAVIAISHAVKGWLVRERGVPSDNITVIHYGIETERFAQPSEGSGFRVQGSEFSAIVGSIGRLEPGKGFDCLIQAMPTVFSRVPQTSLLIAGHDTWGYSDTLRTLITQLQLDESVRLVGFQNDTPSFLQGLDVFAFASRSEGFGQVVVEAMAAGKPVVANRIAPLTEIVRDGETGLLVEPNNPQAFGRAIAWLLQHPQEARLMGKRGQERVAAHFSAERMARETVGVYQKLLSAYPNNCPRRKSPLPPFVKGGADQALFVKGGRAERGGILLRHCLNLVHCDLAALARP
jgi:glycosyltransferase involved in cell wall biosynthesis